MQQVQLHHVLRSYEEVLPRHGVAVVSDTHFYRVLLRLSLDTDLDWHARLERECERAELRYGSHTATWQRPCSASARGRAPSKHCGSARRRSHSSSAQLLRAQPTLRCRSASPPHSPGVRFEDARKKHDKRRRSWVVCEGLGCSRSRDASPVRDAVVAAIRRWHQEAKIQQWYSAANANCSPDVAGNTSMMSLRETATTNGRRVSQQQRRAEAAQGCRQNTTGSAFGHLCVHQPCSGITEHRQSKDMTAQQLPLRTRRIDPAQHRQHGSCHEEPYDDAWLPRPEHCSPRRARPGSSAATQTATGRASILAVTAFRRQCAARCSRRCLKIWRRCVSAARSGIAVHRYPTNRRQY